tara:strand:+ start:10822 stop:11835 length:1014 start_codon:yes stop_codon:yes gene_type:complete
MGFFNKKEDVLDLELTAYGKYLLSQGRLDPVYYAFFDDDVLYDLKAAGSEEFQNDTERRIKYNTPALKTQPNRTGAETRTKEFLLNVTGAWPSTISDNSVAFVDSFNSAPNPFEAQSSEPYIGSLGTSDLKTEFSPSWHLNMLHGEITSSLDYRTANLTASNPGLAHGYVQNIPQLNIELDYRSFFSTPEEIEFLGGGGEAVDAATGISVDYTQLTNAINSDGICLYVSEDYLLIDVEEINGIFGKENFYMEVFVTGAASTPGNSLQPLSFTSDESLLDELGEDTVDYHLNISVDKEIPSQIQENHAIKRYIGHAGSARLRLGRDLYGSTPDEEPCE